MAALRPLLTATAAGGLLAALWFVPSANATVETPKRTVQAQAAGVDRAPQEQPPQLPQPQQAAHTGGDTAPSAAGSGPLDPHLALADTGSVDTTPYLVGGTAFLSIGAGFVAYSARRRGAGGTPA
ncbi:hypothetical protein ACQPZG_13135 [Streptomyces sp. CA-294286]|uniref:hypothetical protein n=1 Tax=Streptomyces sp. CA-294286 TaxID=3240070 RepID=UPI003D8A5547